jgi:hypothetical protein
VTLAYRAGVEQGKPGVTRGRKATELGAARAIEPAHPVSRVAERHEIGIGVSGTSVVSRIGLPAVGRSAVRAVSAAASGARHLSGVGLQALIIVGIVAALLLALAPTFGPADNLAGVEGAAAAGRGQAHIAVPDGVFGGTTTATLNPGGDVWALAVCYQDGQTVWLQYAHADDGKTATFTLGPSPLWQGGAATCIAEEGNWAKNGRWRYVASTTFSVSD